MNAAVRSFVRNRAGNRCEYCHMPQEFHDQTFHLDHIIARKHREDDSDSNLALACFQCSLYKGSDISGIDPATRKQSRLFHPRKDRWADHFGWSDAELIGKTPVGRVTIGVLRMNRPERVNLRRLLLRAGISFD